MKAIIRTQYGPPDILRLEEVEKPVPAANEVLVKIRAASVNPLDWHLMRGSPFFMRFMGVGFFKPKIKTLGVDIAGVVEDVGNDTTQFKPGDEVFGSCSYRGFAEYAPVTEKRIVHKPAGISFEEAAAVPVAAFSALQAVREKGQAKNGQRVMINGASGGVGTFAVQIAKVLGTEVIGVCSTKNLELVRSLGADHVIDYTREDFTKDGQQYDLIVDNAAYRPVLSYIRSIKPDGRYVMVGGNLGQIPYLTVLGWLKPLIGGRSMTFLFPDSISKGLPYLKELMETGKIRSVIDRRYTLSETAEAIRYVEKGHARGKVVITI